ncbi:MAG TPA: hypothetical protein DCF68_16660 [Cyanothece sp. UBA12306]|nr:hypothetical protein [Cyanothece sp. UBA12306]
MYLKYLIDENVDPAYPTQIRSKQPELSILVIGEPLTPTKGTKDPEILCWCEEYGFVLVTNNRRSMPGHLKEHLQNNQHIPGIFILNSSLTIGQNIEELLLIGEGSFPNEYQDQIIYLPLTF